MEAFPHWTTVTDQTGRQKPTGLQQGEGSNVWHWDKTWQRCVWSQSTSLFNTVWERKCFLFIRERAKAIHNMAFPYNLFIAWWKWSIEISILTRLLLIHLSHPNTPFCLSFSKVFLIVEPCDSVVFMRDGNVKWKNLIGQKSACTLV